MRTADAIITADIHLRETTPQCRTDNYWEAQENKIEFLKELQHEHYGCPILDGGDLLDKWKSIPELLTWAINNLPEEIITVPGNHDMPQHNIELLHKSGLAVLEAADIVNILHNGARLAPPGFSVFGYAWRDKVPQKAPGIKGRKVAIIHDMIYMKHEGWPVAAAHAKDILKGLPWFDLIITGHNHTPFVYENGGRLLVNPGSMMRMAADQEKHRPRCYLWYADKNEVKPVYYPIEQGVISRSHLDTRAERDERLEAFVKSIDEMDSLNLDFEGNLETFMDKQGTKDDVRKIIYECLEVE